MTLRISTAGLHAQALQGLLQRQQALAHTQQQLISGNKLLTAADDPAAYAMAQRLDHTVAALEQYERNSGLVEHRLRLQEQALDDVGNILIRARELAIQANSGALADPDRAAIAAELRSLREGLLGVANREDGSGRHLFAGTRDGVAPFVDTGGAVSYAGNGGQNRIDIAPDLAVADTNAGSEIFMRVRTGDGEIRGRAGAGNTGSGVLQSSAVTDYAAWGGQSLTVEFTAADAYRVVDATGAVLATGAWTPDSAIAAGGVQLELTGAPAAGDTFTVERAPTRAVFATLERLADALEAPTATAADEARRDNVISASIADLGTAHNHMLGIRASTGSRLATLDHATQARSAESVSLSATLSQLRDVNLAEATTELNLHLTALEAARRTMVQVQGLSLFDLLR